MGFLSQRTEHKETTNNINITNKMTWPSKKLAGERKASHF